MGSEDIEDFLSVNSRSGLQNTRITKTGRCWVIKILVTIISAGWLMCLLSSCATPYQPMGALGGYQEEQLAPDIYRVAFYGNGYTNPQTASEYLIHRCAELTEQKGYRYFGILAVSDQSVTRTFTTPAHSYTTGTGYATAIGNTAFGSYNGTTYYTPAQTLSFNFPRPVLTIKMSNNWLKGSNQIIASTILSVQMPGTQLAPIQSGSSYSGPRMALDEQTKSRIISFVQRFVAATESDDLSLLTTYYGPNVRFNGTSITREALREQVETAVRTFPQRSWQFISGPTVTPASDSPGATVNYELSGVLSNGTTGMQVKTSVQLTVEKQGDQFKIVAISPRVLEHRPL
jgi:hypothetical protein